MDKIAIVGPGGIGGFLAVAFTLIDKQITCVASSRSIQDLRDSGISLTSPRLGDHTISPEFSEKLTTHHDLIVVCTKSYSLDEAMDTIADAVSMDTAIMPLLNGFEHLDTLRTRFPGARIIPATIGRIEAKRASTTHIIHTNQTVEVHASPPPELRPAIHDLLTSANIDYIEHETEAEVVWDKLIRLNALACTTALTGSSLGDVLASPEWSQRLSQAVDEARKVAAEDGYTISQDEAMAPILTLPGHISTSLARDVEEGNQTEADALAGAIVRRAAKYRIPTPVIAEFHTALLESERKARTQ